MSLLLLFRSYDTDTRVTTPPGFVGNGSGDDGGATNAGITYQPFRKSTYDQLQESLKRHAEEDREARKRETEQQQGPEKQTEPEPQAPEIQAEPRREEHSEETRAEPRTGISDLLQSVPAPERVQLPEPEPRLEPVILETAPVLELPAREETPKLDLTDEEITLLLINLMDY